MRAPTTKLTTAGDGHREGRSQIKHTITWPSTAPPISGNVCEIYAQNNIL